jgi:hypothetical protein
VEPFDQGPEIVDAIAIGIVVVDADCHACSGAR